MRKGYYLLNAGLVLTLFLLHNGQSPKSEKSILLPSKGNVKNEKSLINKVTIKDSLIKETNQALDNAINYTTKSNQQRDKFIKVKEEEAVAIKNYISLVKEYLESHGRKEKLVIRKNLKQQLKEGEVFLTKDSICSEYKRRFLGSKRCTKWEYTWYLVDKDNNKEKLW